MCGASTVHGRSRDRRRDSRVVEPCVDLMRFIILAERGPLVSRRLQHAFRALSVPGLYRQFTAAGEQLRDVRLE